MTDLISRIAALKEIDWAINLAMDDEMHYAMCTLGERIEELPALDAVPVVRCKDCCYLAKDGKSPFCTYHDNINVTEEFFCATGEVEHADARKPV